MERVSNLKWPTGAQGHTAMTRSRPSSVTSQHKSMVRMMNVTIWKLCGNLWKKKNMVKTLSLSQNIIGSTTSSKMTRLNSFHKTKNNLQILLPQPGQNWRLTWQIRFYNSTTCRSKRMELEFKISGNGRNKSRTQRTLSLSRQSLPIALFWRVESGPMSMNQMWDRRVQLMIHVSPCSMRSSSSRLEKVIMSIAGFLEAIR